jgi:type II secretory pathway pseudopilin PulG
MTIQLRKMIGVTMLEMLLVLAIIGTVMAMIIGFIQQRTDELRRDRTAMQMQMVLNAGLEFYINSNLGPASTWPASIDDLRPTYLPSTANWRGNNPWGQPYTAQPINNQAQFEVSTEIPGSTSDAATANAQAIAGRLPLASISLPHDCAGGGGTMCVTLSAQVAIPGQNLNNARAVNFGSVYSVNGCVPKPVCPLNMTPEIFVVPVSVSGTNDAPGNTTNMYPISSYTGYALPNDIIMPGTGAQSCSGGTEDCNFNPPGSAPPAGTHLWRVCLSVTTEKGPVPASVQMGSVMAITRCAPSGEAFGTALGVGP